MRSANALSTPATWSTRSGSRCRWATSRTAACTAWASGQPQRLVGPGLDLAGAPGALDGQAAQRVEQHRLADAAQAGEHHAAVGTAGGDPFEGDLELLQLAVAAGQLGRALAGAGGVGVPDRVHDRTVSGCLADSVDFASES